MIIYGWNHFRIKSFDSAELGITQQAEPNVRIEIRQRYFHLFWIPIFGIGKTWAIRRDDKLYEVPEELKTVLKNRSDLKFGTPWYTFIGTMVLVAIGIGFLISEKLEANHAQEYKKQQVIATHGQYIDLFRKPSPEDIYQFVSVKGYDLKYAKVTALNKQNIELSLITNPSVYAFDNKQVVDLFNTYADETKTITLSRADSAKLFCKDYDELDSFTGLSLEEKDGEKYRVAKIIRVD